MNNGVVLIIVDGFGIAPATNGNAITQSRMDFWDELKLKYSYTELDASGNAVGLPEGVMGNSEVGHLTIGTGRIQFQSLELINRACSRNTLKDNPVIGEIKNYLLKTQGRLHLLGLLSDGGVHSHDSHLNYFIELFAGNSLLRTYIHAITDGRDTSPKSGIHFVNKLLENINQKENVSLASVVGRYYAMDRDKKWDRTKLAFDLYVNGQGEISTDVLTSIQNKYDHEETDEFLKPLILDRDGIIKEGDAVLFFNFRPDRARQISIAFNNLEPTKIKSPLENKILYTTMTRYEDSWTFPALFDNPKLTNSLAEIIAKNEMHQVHIAETEKYAHVTYFLNGGNESKYPFEQRILVPSLRIPTYDLQPEMSTKEIGEMTKIEIAKEEARFIVVNIAAPDMVGHTGNLEATVKALEFTDEVIQNIYQACEDHDYTLVITSDHGNCEKMRENGSPHTAHTTNKVPFIVTMNLDLKEGMGLSSVAPTILELLKIEIPSEIESESLIKK